jgi:hypothetical protein
MVTNDILRGVICAWLVALSLAWWQACPAAAQEPEPPEYTGLDVVFLVDQSGSMGGRDAGSREHPEPNDPHGWRFDGLVRAVRLLGPALWQTHPESTARMAVIEFGDRAQEVLPVTTIEARSQEDWIPQESDLIARLDEHKEQRSSRNFGNTNHQAAFLLARDLFDEMEAEDDSFRLKVIIVLTDGRPCVGTVNPDTGERGCRPWVPHLTELRDRLIPEHFPAGESYHIYVVAINDSRDNYWPGTREYWEAIAESHGGRAEKVSSLPEIGSFFSRALSELLIQLPRPSTALPPVPPIPEEVESGFYPVIPYLQLIKFMIYKSDPTDWIDLEEVGTPLDVTQSSPDSRITVTGNDSSTMYGQIEVLRPEPGQWRIQKPPGSDVIVEVQGILFNPQLISPVGEHPRGVPVRVELNMVDSNGDFVTGYDNRLYALEVVAAMRTDQGERTLDLAQEKPGVHASLFAPRALGTHTVHLRAISHDPEGNEFTVMDQDAGTFGVGSLVAELGSPSGEVYQNAPVRLAYRFLDSRGNLIQEVGTAEAALTVEVAVTGEDETQTLMLAQEQSGIYAAEYIATRPGPHQAHLVVKVGDATGQEMTVLDEDSGTFEVKPTVCLEYTVLRPQDGARDLIRPWWLFPTRPLVVEVEMRDESGQPVMLNQVVTGAPEQAFTLGVTDPAGRDRSSEVSWSMTGAPGRLRAVSEGFNDVGEWTIEVAPGFTPVPGYAMVDCEATQLTVTRAEHYLALGVDGAVLLGIVAAVVTWVVHYKAITKPPLLTGALYIRDASGNIVWTRPLTVGRNRATFSGKDLPVTTRLKHISVVRAPGREEAIEVTGTLDNKSAIAASRMLFKSRRQLGAYNLYLDYEQY